ncbi:MAG: T9SS type A sorting domain-containing protein [Saprospiraceae bacterium]|nr:T9SS type A sorting domain-containing protein [Saprospiraceae bacterium]
MKSYLLLTLLCFIGVSANSQKCIDTVANGLTLISKTYVSGNDCNFKIKFCIRKVSEQAHHIVYTIKYSYGTLTRTIYVSNVAVGSVICEVFEFTGNCSSTAYCAAHGKTVNHTLCGAVDEQIILPIKLVSFSAENTANGLVALKWQTATESNVSHFSLQQSADSKLFNEIAKVKAVGESKSLQSYSYLYKSNPTGSSNKSQYYRLKTVDRDGSESFSPIVSIKDKTRKKLEVYPNPASHYLRLNVQLFEGNPVKLYNINGKEIQFQYLDEQTINLSELANGIYYLQYQDELVRFLKN